MDLEQWWPRVGEATQEWLIAHNGEPLPIEIVGQIVAAGGIVRSAAWWVADDQDGDNQDGGDQDGGDQDGSGLQLSDAATDWIEAVANGETPQSP